MALMPNLVRAANLLTEQRRGWCVSPVRGGWTFYTSDETGTGATIDEAAKDWLELLPEEPDHDRFAG